MNVISVYIIAEFDEKALGDLQIVLMVSKMTLTLKFGIARKSTSFSYCPSIAVVPFFVLELQ
jgi:hypothetical protein